MIEIDWEKRLRQRRATIDRAEKALEEDIADAHALGKLSWRKIGAAAEVNHEWARQKADQVKQRRAASEPVFASDRIDAPATANPGRAQLD